MVLRSKKGPSSKAATLEMQMASDIEELLNALGVATMWSLLTSRPDAYHTTRTPGRIFERLRASSSHPALASGTETGDMQTCGHVGEYPQQHTHTLSLDISSAALSQDCQQTAPSFRTNSSRWKSNHACVFRNTSCHQPPGVSNKSKELS